MTATLDGYRSPAESPEAIGLTVVVATYDGAQQIVPLLRRLDAVLEDRAEVVVVDDGTDDLPDRVAWLGRRLRVPVRVLRRDTPLGGQVGAIGEGLHRGAGEVVVVWDGSELHPPEAIPDLVAALADADVAVASRFARGGPVDGVGGLRRRVGSRASLVPVFSSDPTSGLFALRRAVLDAGATAPTGTTLLQGILALAPGRLRVIDVPCPRSSRTSHASRAEGLALVRAALTFRFGRGARPTTYLPSTPDDEEKYSYFARQVRWPFVVLFLGQALVVYAFVEVALRSYLTMALLLVVPLMVVPVTVNLWLRLRSHRGTLAQHLGRVEAWRATGTRPSVDVFLPVCGEPRSVLRNTWAAVEALRSAYDGPLRVHVLDDAAMAWTRDLAHEHGFRYVVRPNRGELKKAGNLISAFEHTSSDFILVLDADFCPRPDFLAETLPYFDEPATGVVQTSQFFDTGRGCGLSFLARTSGALQNLFFHWTQSARDTYEAAICAGTNVVYRRAAVAAAGGFARVPIGEDVHSGVKLWAAGWHTRYLRLNLAKGVAPDTFAGIVNQQVRWCRSSMLLMVNKNFTEAPFTLRQRICFWAAFVYYMQSAAVLVTLPIPTTVMLWGYPGEIRLWYYLPIVPGFLSSVLVFPRLSRGWSPAIFKLTIIYSVCHLLAITHALQGVVKAWVPTGAATRKTDLPREAMRLLRAWLVIVQSIVWSGVWRALLLHVPAYELIPVMVLATIQLVLVVPTLLDRHDTVVASDDLPAAVAEAGAA